METTLSIHGGDYDCSEAVRMCYRAAGVLPYGSYMWTGNELELLTAHGFAYRDPGSPQDGDVLWRSGHTELYLHGGFQGGARHGDYPGGLDGNQGDQSGTEVTRSAYDPDDWEVLLRYEGGHTCDGIPAAYVAARVMDHIIDHQAHGYSQPNRAGDGTIESLTIEWDGNGTPSNDDGTPSIGEGDSCGCDLFSGAFVFLQDTNIRVAPTISAEVVGVYDRGEAVILDGHLTRADGHLWGRYTGSTSGKLRYVAVATLDFVEPA